MSTVISKEFVEFLKERTRGTLRVVAQYHANGHDLIYVREDIETEYTEYDFRGHMDAFRRDAATGSHQEQQLSAGDQHCSIRVFDETIIFNIIHDKEVGTIISLDPTAGRDLLGFIGTTLEQLHDTTDQEVKSRPDWL